MAKVIFNPMIDIISGKFNRIVVSPNSKVLNVAGQNVSGLLRIMGDHTNYLQQSLNARQAWRLVAQGWNAGTTTEKGTWQTEAALISSANSYSISGYNLFMAYMMEMFFAFMTDYTYPTALSAGTSYNYIDRATHAWS